MGKTVSIIIPVFNEEHTIGELVTRVFQSKLPGWRKQIVIVDDGSIDSTKKILEQWKSKCTVLSVPTNQGKGAAIGVGLRYAEGDIVIIQDADLEYDPKDYQQLIIPFGSPSVHAVYGSRFLGPHLSTMFLYALGNKFVTLVTNILYNTNITDMETGYKAFRRSTLTSIPLRAQRFDFEPEITAKLLKRGYQIYEVPISYYGRKFSEGKKLTWRDGVVALWMLFKYRFTE